MTRRSVVAKLVVFTVIAVLGIGYVLFEYVGAGAVLLGRQYTVYLDLPDSGGIFTTASVTYRGVEIGRVGPITLRPGGIRVALDLSTSYRIPSNVAAYVADGSPIGEQYVDLRPRTNSTAQTLHDGSTITADARHLPTTSQQVLVSVDRLMRSVPRHDLADLVTELGKAFDDTGPSLQRLLDSTHVLVAAARWDLPRTVGLLRTGGQVLDTQNQMSNDIVAFSRHLSSLTHVLRTHDADLAGIIRDAPATATEAAATIRSVDATLPILLGNLVSLGRVAEVRIPALRQVLIIYPYVVATSFGLFPGDGSTRFGVPLPPSESSQPCEKGYIPPSKWRSPSIEKYPPIHYHNFCKEPTHSSVGPRGSREAPEPGGGRLGDQRCYVQSCDLPGGPPSGSGRSSGRGANTGGATIRFVAPNGRRFLLNSTGGQQRVVGDQSWMALVFGPLK